MGVKIGPANPHCQGEDIDHCRLYKLPFEKYDNLMLFSKPIQSLFTHS